MSDDAHRIQSTEVVRKLLHGNGWRLLSVEQLVADLLQQPASEQLPPEQLRVLAIQRYCALALHPACLGSLGEEPRQRAFEELWNHLHRMAGATHLPITHDHVQEAVVELLTKSGDCRKPEQFLNFAVKRMYDIARRPFRRTVKEHSLDEMLDQDLYGELEASADVIGATPENTEKAVLLGTLRGQLHERFQTLRQTQPRAGRQLEAAWLRYMHRLSIEECAEKLETSVSNASVLVTRGLNHFRQDSEFTQLIQEIAAFYETEG